MAKSLSAHHWVMMGAASNPGGPYMRWCALFLMSLGHLRRTVPRCHCDLVGVRLSVCHMH